MLELTFISTENTVNTVNTISVSEMCFERLAKIGFSRKVTYKQVNLTIEEEKHSVSATKLTKNNRSILLNLIECERQSELERLFEKMDEKPTIKEIRDNFSYIKELTELYRLVKLDSNIYFSYE
jgi:hypothetical protein